MKYAKFLFLPLFILSLSACGAEKTEETAAPAPVPHAEVSETEEDKPSEEITKAGLFDNKIQINGKVLTFPMTVDEFVQATGFGDEDEDMTAAVHPGERQLYRFDNKDVTVDLHYCNQTEKSIPKGECIVYSLELYTLNTTPGIFYPGGFGTDMTHEEMVEKFGEPKDDGGPYIYYEEYFGGSDGGKPYSATGKRVELDMYGECISYKGVYTYGDLDEPRLMPINRFKDDNGDELLAAADIPQRFLARSLVTDEYDTAGKYENNGLTGELVILFDMRGGKAESEEEFLKAVDMSKDDIVGSYENIIVAYENIESETDRILGRFYTYDKNTRYVSGNTVWLKADSEIGLNDTENFKTYAADIFSTIRTIPYGEETY